MSTSKYVIAHGSVKLGKDEYAKVGDTVDMDDDFIKSIDPKGECFVSEEKWLAMEEKKELEQRIAELSDDQRTEALKSFLAKPEEPTKKKKQKNESEG